MTTMRRRRQFKAQLLTLQGVELSECFAIIDIETTRNGDLRERSWRGRFSSLSDPQHAFSGAYLLRARGGAEEARIEVVEGAAERLGVTSDEYLFLGSGDPPPSDKQRSQGRRGRASQETGNS